ncbi:MAG: hypothetical protein CM1200mP2_18800 [Planctomycetaceae bacterium]|nr:MAG: hypothetical protein CM1200mP2_18800 [Planctomycetaceae bacterium]
MKTDTDAMRSARRHFLAQGAMSLAPLAMSWAMQRDGLQAAPVKPELARQSFDLLPKHPRKPPRATAMISMFMQGGPSQVDLMDPKPELNRLDGKQFPGTIKYDNAAQASSRVLGSPWKFRQQENVARRSRSCCRACRKSSTTSWPIRSMPHRGEQSGQSIHAMNTGRTQRGRPALGSWLTFGLGADTDELPAYVAMTDPRGLPVEGVLNWFKRLAAVPVSRNGGAAAGTEDPEPGTAGKFSRKGAVELSRPVDPTEPASHRQRKGELELEARIANFRLAARMQTAAREALDIGRESKATHAMYGLDDKATVEFGTRCLIARGWSSGVCGSCNCYQEPVLGPPRLDSPEPARLVPEGDRPAAALVADLNKGVARFHGRALGGNGRFP